MKKKYTAAQEKRKIPSILVIDNNPNTLKLLKNILISDGYEVILASDGNRGVQLIKERKVDLVLLDIILPAPNGYETLSLIREFSAVPIIIISGYRGPVTLELVLKLGADDFVLKPFDTGELLARIRAKLRHDSWC